MKNQLKDGASPSAKFASDWMMTNIFMQWFDHLVNHVRPTQKDPVLLALDGQSTHTKNLEFILKARENHTTVVRLPPPPPPTVATSWNHLTSHL